VSGGATCRSLIVFGGATIKPLSHCDELWGSDNPFQLLKKSFLGEIWLAVRVCFNLLTEEARKWVFVRLRMILISQIWIQSPTNPSRSNHFPTWLKRLQPLSSYKDQAFPWSQVSSSFWRRVIAGAQEEDHSTKTIVECCVSVRRLCLIQQRSKGEGASKALQLNLHL
jgi:hypothetical protein